MSPSTLLRAMAGYLLVNPRSGDDRPSADELVAETRSRGLDVHLLQPGDDSAELAKSADASAVGVAGGDGSMAPIAAVAAARGVPFVCIPFGTRNHFARDLGLDRNDPIRALDAFEGTERLIDLGRVGDRAFLNNVSLGDYARLVHRRESHPRRREALAGTRALWLLLQRRGLLTVRVDGRPVSARVILAANNRYELDLFSLGERERLDEGRIHLYLAHGWLPLDWEERSSESITVEGGNKLEAAIDGEPVELEPPLEFRIEPRALRVLVPQSR